MFTGIVEETGRVLRLERSGVFAALTVSARTVLEGTRLGDSIAVNGVCLTVTGLDADSFSADVMHETLNRSSLGALRAGSAVNLERALQAGGRFGGHIVSGHIDGVGQILQIRRDGNAVWFTVSAPQQLMRYVVEKGSIALDGISLTVAGTGPDWFSVSAIPHTVASTALAGRRVRDIVNLETDLIGKYVEKLLQPAAPASGLTLERLQSLGY